MERNAPPHGMAVILQNLCFWPLFLATSALTIPIAAVPTALMGLLLPHKHIVWFVRRLVTWYGRMVMWCAWPFVRVRYRDLAPQERESPYILICNHRSASDPFLMAVGSWDAVQLVNDWPLRLPVLGWIARLVGYVDITNMPVEKFYEKGEKLLNQGVCIISFPEGTRSGSRGMGSFTSSIFRLALRARVPLVPLAISGNESIPPKGSLMLHPGKINVHKLSAVTPKQYGGMDVFQLKSHLRDVLQRHLDQVEREE